MSMMVSFVLSFFPRDVLDEILNLIESVSEDFPSYSLVELSYMMLHTKCQGHWSIGSGEEDFLRFFYMGMAAILVM